jgi:3-oxoacyl-[acyl-carrier-protein] synthase-1
MAGLSTSLGKPRWVLSDVNGERHRIREWSLVDIRQLGNDVMQQRYATQLGDIGAAVGPTLLAIACQQFQRGIAPAQRVVVALHSEGAERGVFALQAVGQ